MELMGVYEEELVEPLAQVMANWELSGGWLCTDRISWMRYP